MSELWIAVISGVFAILASISAGFSLFIARKAYRIVLDGNDKAVLEDILRQWEARMKALESEWNEVYDKFDRMSRRRAGALGGRPPKDEIPASEVMARPNTKAERRAAIMAKARGAR